jgi:DNA-binding MarR family transcriptional regulator
VAGSRLQVEIKQTRPFASRTQEAFLGILKTADILRRQSISVLTPTGLSHEQYNILRILRGAGKDGLPTLEVASRLIEQSPAITRTLDKLESKGLIRRERCEQDRRQVLCYILPAGLELLAKLDRPITEADARGLVHLSERELEQLIGLLDRVRNDCKEKKS